jgi:hypothetical protein
MNNICIPSSCNDAIHVLLANAAVNNYGYKMHCQLVCCSHVRPYLNVIHSVCHSPLCQEHQVKCGKIPSQWHTC